MKKSDILVWAALMTALAFPCGLCAADRGTPQEAQALVQKAVEHYQAVGRTQALQDFTGKKTPWVDRDLYVMCIDKSDTIVANGSFPSYVGMSADLGKDADGKAIGKAAWDSVAPGGTGSIKYPWFNPVTGKTETKTSFYKKAGEDICGVGVFTPS